MFELISRNRKVYTRDRLAFFMSFLSVIILILVYQVFLGQLQIDAIKEALGSDTASSDTIKMVNYWLISGLTTIISMTSTLGAFGVMVSDKEKKLSEDFKVSPISNFKVELSYAIFAILFGIILTMFSCVFAIGIFNGLSSLLDYSVMDYLKIFGIVSLSTVLSAAIVLPILAFIRTSSAFTTLSTIVGTFIGFISGVYLSIGSVGETLQQVMTWFPMTQVNALLKQVLMKDSIAQVFDGAPSSVVNEYKESYGVVLQNAGGDHLFNQFMLVYISMIIVALLTLHFFIKKVKK
ncbi:ABC transporter permease [Streptococcus gordonii]|uniref:ABC transporter-like protein CylB n=1 Tax=Streptococcus gordonii (strain Challis / ATCC 35105 / BCRC 15272 / CH1 / DL1 / V288) TaxID=467705 RepID=A8AZ55_STRGC|nr:ABC transporter permease [Streptococcus gordonii]ABV09702.1 ABC transporter-like protein CylB [Streptococcus gordonii str. Challis substr. CH1]MBZ2137752.1 ABC transporter permease [Streptococcus gordonii]QGS44097.1 ABC transporter permease [Streptococcus gordonii]VEE22738.1 ABC transporter-like protein CylB [Streptococcus gordonii]VTS43118.1 ABC transporter-like protein CylB [Streptococcus gordonii]